MFLILTQIVCSALSFAPLAFLPAVFIPAAFLPAAFIPAAHALPAKVDVRLFKARPQILKLTIAGPADIDGINLPPFKTAQLVREKGAYRLKMGHSSVPARARLIVQTLGPPLGLSADDGTMRHYRGTFAITTGSGGINVVNTVDLRSYITSVVGSESLPDFPFEALKAQAVLANTVLARCSGPIDDTTSVQAYLGSDYERPLVKDAVAATAGVILKTRSGSAAPVYYHSTCSGGTSDYREIFSGTLLRRENKFEQSAGKFEAQARKFEPSAGVKCAYCRLSPFFKPLKTSVSRAELLAKTGCYPLGVTVKDKESRVLQVKLETASGRKIEIAGYQYWLKLGQGLGWGAVPGMRYAISLGADGSCTFESTGAGHGAGLCQWGAAGMARAGKGYRGILKHYFPTLALSNGTVI
jgi:stage II sporulation protein D